MHMWCYVNLYSSGAIVETDLNQQFQTLFHDFDVNQFFLEVGVDKANGNDVSQWDTKLD